MITTKKLILLVGLNNFMERQEIISYIKSQINEGTISKNDLSEIISSEISESQSKDENSKSIINIFYIIGAIIAVIGIIVLTVQNWDTLGFLGRIFVTLGASIVSYVVAYILKGDDHKTLSQVLFTVSAVLAPIGTNVLLKEANIDPTPLISSVISLGWAIVFGVALWGTMRNILILFTIGYATVALYFFTGNILGDYYYSNTIFKTLTIIIGVSYSVIAYYLNTFDKEKKSIQGILYGLSTIGILGSLISFDGVFNLITIAVIFGAFYASVFLKSRSMLILSALFLIGHIIKITGVYFADSINWAFALILVGFLIIGIGYSTYYLNKKYISDLK